MKKEKYSTEFLVRLNNADVAEMINELLETKVFKSRNELINKMLTYGAPEVYERVFHRRKNTKSVTGASGAEMMMEQLGDVIERQKKEVKEHDEMFTLLTVVEFLTTNLLNIEIAKSSGTTVSKTDIENGLYATLPEKLERLKASISGKID